MRLALVRTYQPVLVDDLAHPLGIMSLDAYLGMPSPKGPLVDAQHAGRARVASRRASNPG